MTEFRTSACTAHQHPEFTLRFLRDVPVPGLEKLLLGYFENAVASGTKFKAGQTVQLGWATLRLTQREDGTFGVLEPDLKTELKWIESVDQSLLETWRQKEVLESVGLLEQASYPRQALQAVVCSRVWDAAAFMMGRTAASAPTDSGWFVGCMDEAHDHQTPDALSVVPLIEIAVKVPPLTQFFALPEGSDVVVTGPGRVRARVFFEGKELQPRESSYLSALNRQD